MSAYGDLHKQVMAMAVIRLCNYMYRVCMGVSKTDFVKAAVSWAVGLRVSIKRALTVKIYFLFDKDFIYTKLY